MIGSMDRSAVREAVQCPGVADDAPWRPWGCGCCDGGMQCKLESDPVLNLDECRCHLSLG